MLRHPLYLVFSLAVLSLVAVAEYRGWGLASVNEVRGVPRSIRDNPGAYRTSYGSRYYRGGK
jgi:hypothetical protein